MRFCTLATIMLLASLAAVPAASGADPEVEQFLSEEFGGDVPSPSQIWLVGERSKEAARILGHPYKTKRVRYWQREGKRVFVLDEIGKERPITAGFVVAGGRLQRVAVLIFRESRGGEVRRESFTRQFEDAALDERRFLDRRIDGISGATLSVGAIERLARLALWLATESEDKPSG